MADYAVTPDKLQELNVKIDEGGTLPGDVSNALAATEVALAAGDIPAAKKANTNAVNINKKNTPVWQAMQAWHDSVKSGPVCGGVTPPDPPSPEPSGDVHVNLTWGVLSDRNPTGDPFVLSSIIATLAVPADAVPMPTMGRFTAFEYGGPPITKEMVVSTVSGSYTQGVVAQAGGPTPEIMFNVGTGPGMLAPGTTYYINTRNVNPGTGQPEPGNYPSAFGYQPARK